MTVKERIPGQFFVLFPGSTVSKLVKSVCVSLIRDTRGRQPPRRPPARTAASSMSYQGRRSLDVAEQPAGIGRSTLGLRWCPQRASFLAARFGLYVT